MLCVPVHRVVQAVLFDTIGAGSVCGGLGLFHLSHPFSHAVDYVGAPWSDTIKVNPELVLNMKENVVGNGGFSLRSNKLAKTTSTIDFNSLKFPVKSEDIVICHYLYKEMVKKGIKFAPPETAAQFSIENVNNLYGQQS